MVRPIVFRFIGLSMPISTHLYRLCTLAMIGVIAGAAHSALRPVSMVPIAPPRLPEAAPGVAGQVKPAPPQVAAPLQPSTDPHADIDITLAQAKALYDQGVIFVDSRSPQQFAEKQIEGALNLPLEFLEGGARPDALNIIDPGAKVVIYCSGGDCHASHDVAIRLNALGYNSCYVLKDGIPAWEAAGYPMTVPGGGK